MNKNISRGLVLVATALIATSSFALTTPPDMSSLTGAVDFSTVTAAVLSIAGFLAVVYIAVKGAQIGLGMLKRG